MNSAINHEALAMDIKKRKVKIMAHEIMANCEQETVVSLLTEIGEYRLIGTPAELRELKAENERLKAELARYKALENDKGGYKYSCRQIKDCDYCLCAQCKMRFYDGKSAEELLDELIPDCEDECDADD